MKAAGIYVDPSALARLYLHQDGSREMARWRAKVGGTLVVTHHGRVGIINAICRAVFLGHITQAAARESLAALASDFADGALRPAEILWRAALNRAATLAERHTPTLGLRTLDVLHVACALELKARHFLTFDHRQRALASAVALRPVKL